MINKVKEQRDGWLVNGSMLVPNNSSNRHYKEVQEWLAKGNTPDPEYTNEELLQQKKAIDNAEARSYLASTDWYITRFIENGVAIPQSVSDARKASRLAVK